jgi:hypothetical protein
LIRLVPKIYQWRIRTRIYRRYGELKYLETQMSQEKEPSPHAYRDRLDQIEARVNEMRVPLEFTEHLYSLRGHIQFVRDRIETTVEKSTT